MADARQDDLLERAGEFLGDLLADFWWINAV
jgi:hypothetical protein